MSYIKTMTALARAGADINLKKLNVLSNRRLRSIVASAQEEQNNVSNKEGTARSESLRQGRGTSTTNKISVDFDQTQEAYKSKDSLELLRSLVVFKLCSYDFLVDKHMEVGCAVWPQDNMILHSVKLSLSAVQKYSNL